MCNLVAIALQAAGLAPPGDDSAGDKAAALLRKFLFPPRMVEKVDLMAVKDPALRPRLQRYCDAADLDKILSSPPLA